MAPRHYHSPPPPNPTRPRCPVCNATVYSTAGIHPQCAVRQADPPRPKARPAGAASQSARPAGALEPAVAEVAVVTLSPPADPPSVVIPPGRRPAAAHGHRRA